MAWNDAPPTAEDLKTPSWDSTPPTKEELQGPGILKSIRDTVAGGIQSVGDKYERYITAPTRAALIEDAKNGASGHPISAFIGQLGEDPSKASGRDLLSAFGVDNKNKAISDEKLSEIQGQYDQLKSIYGPNSPDLKLFEETHLKPAIAMNQQTKAQGYAPIAEAVADPLLVLPAGEIAKGALGAIRKGASLAYDATGGLIKGIAGATDAVTGTGLASKAVGGAGRMVDSVGSVAEAANSALKKVFTPAQAKDFPEMAAIAQKNGIDASLLPESVEFGKGSFLDSASRARREGPLGEEYLQKFTDGQRQVQTALDNKVTQIGGGAPLSTPAAGVELRKSFDKAVQNFWDSIEITHDNIVSQYAPGLHVDSEEMGKLNSVLNGVEKFAKGTKIRTLEKAQAQELLDAVDAVRSGNGSYKQMVETMRSVGNAAFDASSHPGVLPADTQKLRKMYFAMDDALINTVEKHVNPDFAAELRANNGAIHDMFEKKNQIGNILADKNIAPEDAFKRVVLNGDTDQLATLIKTVPPEDIQKLKGAFIESLIKREPDGSFNMSSLYNAMRNKQNQIKILFKPDEIEELGELLKLGDRFGKAVLSTSGTGASGVFHHITSSLKSGVANDTLIESLKDKARSPTIPISPGESQRSPLFFPAKGAQILGSPSGLRGPSSNDGPMQRRMQLSK